MVVATDGLIDKGQYKHFRLKRKSKSDFDQLEEALERRFKNDWPTPDLIVIDGGVPQLRKLQKVLDQMAEPPRMIGLAKHPDRLIIPHFDYSNNQRIEYTKIELALSDPGLNLLQQLRDEAHRFGNKYRLKLQKTTFKS